MNQWRQRLTDELWLAQSQWVLSETKLHKSEGKAGGWTRTGRFIRVKQILMSGNARLHKHKENNELNGGRWLLSRCSNMIRESEHHNNNGEGDEQNIVEQEVAESTMRALRWTVVSTCNIPPALHHTAQRTPTSVFNPDVSFKTASAALLIKILFRWHPRPREVKGGAMSPTD